MHISDWIRSKIQKSGFLNLANARKAELPGWAFVVSLIIGLLFLLLIIYIAWASKDKMGSLFDSLRELF